MTRLLLALLLALLPLQALAHAQLRASDPAEGAVLAEAPAVARLAFNEAVAPLILRLIGPDGAASDPQGRAENATLTVALPAGLARGTQLLSWRVVSDDGHPVGGTLTFHIGAPSATPPTPAELAAGAARMAAALRLALTVALVTAVGLGLFSALVARAPMPPALLAIGRVAAAATLPLGACLIGVQGLDMLSLPVSAFLSAAPWTAGLAAPVAVTVALSVLAAGLAGVGTPAGDGRLRSGFALGAWALAALSFAASGHAAAAAPRALTVPAVALHAAALIFWMGALLPLLLALRGPQAGLLLRRFSSLAVPLVGLLVLSGATLTWAQAGSLAALAGSAYGLVLGAKLALVAGLLALAARNRLLLTPALAAGRADAAPRLARAIRAEIVLGLLVLALASSFRLTPPPRALIEPAKPLYAHIHTARAMADIRLTPGRAGPVEVSLGPQTGDFDELVPQEVEVVLTQPETGIEPIRLTALHGGDGLWHAGPVTLPVPGEWEVALRLLISDFERVTLTGTLTLPD
ncbi:copper resistance CopC/CopD family protein [Rhodobacter calidifons]|uniref:Copper resistance protein CopC/CopD n=1 Tax=Rhodobacter calidifons TaxID=2715277 RepID=A0ABX0GAV0_9RHOB|nr:CopD family protein [Rhodobacter calidifons]NHB78455.1 copper resistance protein CopC/CopD [Rhodobacter calidifons]